ncbi:MAG: hypothetical protein KBD06_02615 [Candidatus Pacebacteria bacterium]|nr:hypothetical protein [Candidatus Paceibacterota bacterium]
MNIPLSLRKRVKKLGVASLFVIALFTGSAAIADIVSGLATTGTSSNVTITNLPINKPSDVAVGDLMIASIAIHDGSAVSVTAPTGWTQILRTDNDTNIGIVSYWKAAGVSEPSSYTWVLSPQTRAQGGITRYSGVDISNPIDAAAGNFNRSKIATTSSITTTADNDEIVTVYALHVGSNNFAGDFFSTPTGMTEKYDSSKTTAGPTIASFDAVQVAAGVVGSKSATISGNPNQQRDWASQQIALRAIPPLPADNFESSANGQLAGQSGGGNWSGSWTGSTQYLVQDTVAQQGLKAVKVTQGYGEDFLVERSFSPLTTGTLHWSERKDSIDHDHGINLYSGTTYVGQVDMRGTGRNEEGYWALYTGSGVVSTGVQYSVGAFDSVDVQFDASIDKFRVSINGGSYTAWYDFVNPASSIDRIELFAGSSGYSTTDGYWDDIRLSQ